MKLKEIVAISGQSGLYKFLAQSSNGIIVESLADGRRMNCPSTSRVSTLAEIALFTQGEDMPLGEVFDKLYQFSKGDLKVTAKDDPAKIKKLFADFLPEYDPDRVHFSDMKKVVAWFAILTSAGMTSFKDEEEEQPEAEKPEETKPKAEKPKAKKKE